jgi:hypothetical protein
LRSGEHGPLKAPGAGPPGRSEPHPDHRRRASRSRGKRLPWPRRAAYRGPQNLHPVCTRVYLPPRTRVNGLQCLRPAALRRRNRALPSKPNVVRSNRTGRTQNHGGFTMWPKTAWPRRGQNAARPAESLRNGRERLAMLGGNRGRERPVSGAPPPSEPDGRFSRIRLSSQWALCRD